MQLDGVDLRYIQLGKVELVRRIYAAVRDHNWNTIAGTVSDVALTEDAGGFELTFAVSHRSEDIDFGWEGRIAGTADGRVELTMTGRAAQPLLYNRIGFCVLHPWRECAGQPFRGETPDGPIAGTLPRLIAPQRFENGVYVPLFPSVHRLEIDIAGAFTTVFEFEGDLFETEDQRNFGDASFKTYCTPLAGGFPLELQAGQAITQKVVVYSVGDSPPPAAPTALRLEIGAPTGTRMPPIGVCLAQLPTEEELALLRALDPAHLRADVHLADPDWPQALEAALRVCRRAGTALELAVFVRADHSTELDRLSRALAGTELARVLVAPEGAQTATQEETTAPGLVILAREHLGRPDVPHAGGTDMYFCELNRTRPRTEVMDGIFWSLNPQVHAFDDFSLLETPETLGEQVRAARSFAGGKQLFIGPLTLRRRYNVNATVAEVAPDPADPRQTAPIAAVWAAANAKYLAEENTRAITFFEACGPRGVIDGGGTLPAYEALAHLCALRDAEVLACRSTRPPQMVGLAVRRDGIRTLLAANLTSVAQMAEVSGLESVTRIQLAPYELVRIDSPHV